MKDYEIVLQKFIEEKNYLNNPYVEGIIFYGSYSTGYNSSCSDLDLHIIFSDEDMNHSLRGGKVIDGFEVEYFEKNLSYMYQKAKDDFQHQHNAILSIVGHGNLLFDRYGNVEKLRKYIIDLYGMPLPGLSEEDAKNIVISLTHKMKHIRKLSEEDNIYFDHIYQVLAETIRTFYHELNAFMQLPSYKIYRFYHDTDGYKDAIFKNVPDEKFIELFDKAITSNESKEKRIEHLNNLYNYVIRGIDIDPSNYQIKFKSKKKINSK